MVEDYHAELDTSPFLEGSEDSKYQKLIDYLNWIITLCRFDVQYATSTLARYSISPKEGHRMAALLSRQRLMWTLPSLCHKVRLLNMAG